MHGPKWQFLLAHGPDMVVLIVGTSFVPWVELPVQRRLCPIFVSDVGLPASTSILQVDGLSTGPPGMGRHSLVSELRYTNS